MFCPKCKCEYRDGFTTCSDCNISLVDKLQVEINKNKVAQPMDHHIDYEFILSTYNPSDVMMLKATLDSEKIVYFLQGENLNLTGVPARLLVKKEHVDQAKDIISQLELKYTFI